jgi:hypothetical protein
LDESVDGVGAVAVNGELYNHDVGALDKNFEGLHFDQVDPSRPGRSRSLDRSGRRPASLGGRGLGRVLECAHEMSCGDASLDEDLEDIVASELYSNDFAHVNDLTHLDSAEC